MAKKELLSSEELVRQLLLRIGENPDRPGLKDTPKRVVKMWEEVFRGYWEDSLPNITVCENGSDGIFYQDMIIDSGYFFSHCEHHMVPFFGKYWFSYIPDKWVIGASKIARVIDHHSAKLQVAERLVHNVVDTLEESLKPKGMMLIMSGRHLCKEMRGIRKYNSPFDVDAVRGCYEGNPTPSCKMEFLMRIGNER